MKLNLAQKHSKLRSIQRKILTLFLLSAFSFQLSVLLCGCEAFRKKFVRKPKREKEVTVVVKIQEYESKYSTAETYKKYFLFWRCRHEELVNLLNAQEGNRKKRIFSAKKIIENLQQMQKLLLPQKQIKLESFISEQKAIVEKLDRYNLSRGQRLRIKSTLGKQRKKIQEEFAYRHIQEHLIK